jgi:hypothetical protein
MNHQSRVVAAGRASAGVMLGLLLAASAAAQDLDPRAYARAPVNSTVAIAGFAFSTGGVVTDPSAPVQNIDAQVSTASIGVARVFNLFGKTAQALAALPYTWADVTGDVADVNQRAPRSGLADARLRLSVLLAGAPARTLAEMMKDPARRPVFGASLTVSAPTGQYQPERLVNLGTNRWAFKPEVALSYPVGPKWLIDVYGGVWFFTTNGEYFPGASVRTQKRVGALQAHVSYSFSPKAWVAFDSTWYRGGDVEVDGAVTGRRQSSSRVGATFVFPVGRSHSIKVAYSTGAIVRFGANFNAFSVGWQTGWIDRSTRPQ